MSKIGSNIRKIRLTKGLSQTQFAELFSLTRASIGAYEEGRAEPKIDTAIEIAKYFSIPLDTIFTKNITVNELTNFNVSNNSNAEESKDELKKSSQLNYIDFDLLSDKSNLVEHIKKKKKLKKIEFPKLITDADTFIDLKKALIEGIHNQNIEALICSSIKKPVKGKNVALISSKEIAIGNYIGGTSIVSLKPLNSTEIKKYTDVILLLEIKLFISSNLDYFNYLDSRFSQIEERLKKIEE